MNAADYGMSEAEFRAMQEKHRAEAEAIRAGIKARKKKIRLMFQCGEIFIEAFSDYTAEDLVKLMQYVVADESIIQYAARLKEEGH